MTTKYVAALAIATIMVPTVQAETFATSTGTFTRGPPPAIFQVSMVARFLAPFQYPLMMQLQGHLC